MFNEFLKDLMPYVSFSVSFNQSPRHQIYFSTMKKPIAVVGTSCRLPGSVSSPSRLFELLQNPQDILRDLDPERLSLSSFQHCNGNYNETANVPYRSYTLDDSGLNFDASFFKISAAEAEAMDPQQRILLETTYEALEAAGYSLSQMRGSSTSVFVGAMTSDYHDIQTRDLDTISRWHATGTSPSILSNRVSYFFDLKGPSMTINTACSSSLVALHQAAQSLRSGDCTTAIVAGVNLLLDADTYLSHSNLQMLSPTSRCRMWDQDADGYARGEGCAAVVIKTLEQALEDGDDVECIIRDTAVNSDGRSPGITMPSTEAQTALIRRAYEGSGLDPVLDKCQYFECHGTGTQAGDPVEAQAIQQAFYPNDATFDPQDKMYVGSIKTLIGHLEGCAGLAGLLKAIMCLKNRTITPNLHFHHLNPNIAPFYEHLSVPTSNIPWPSVGPGHPMRASVNSFGFGGTNAHAIIESYIPIDSSNKVRHCKEHVVDAVPTPMPFVFSGHTQHSLHLNIERLIGYMKENQEFNLDSLAFTLARRSVFPFRISITTSDRNNLLQCLSNIVNDYKGSEECENNGISKKHSSETKGIMGIFTGQGAQWPRMGRELLKISPVFRRSIERCERALASLHDGPSWSLQEELLADKGSSHLSNPQVSQPLTTAIEIALYDFLCACGITLDAVVGHSSGEIVAAYVLEVISAEDAMKIAYYRGLHTTMAQTGGMLAIGLPFADAIQLCSRLSLSERVVPAASNGPTSTTLSGDYDAILEIKKFLDERGTFARVLQVDTAYHSHHMLPCAVAYRKSLENCNIQPRASKAGCIWISSVTEESALQDIQKFAAEYWVDNMVKPVLFAQAIEKTHNRVPNLGACIEIGPHPALRGPTLETLRSKLNNDILYTSPLHRGRNDLMVAASAIGCLWEMVPERVNIGKLLQAFGKQGFKRIKAMPTYSWDHRTKYWRESRLSRKYRLGSPPLHPLLGRRCTSDTGNEMSWRKILRPENPWLQGQKINGKSVLSAGFYFASLAAAATSAAGNRYLALLEINDFVVVKPFIIENCDTGIELVTTIQFHGKISDSRLDAQASCHACLVDGSSLAKLCTARLILDLSETLPDSDQLPPREKRHHTHAPVNVATLYGSFEQVGLDFSAPFRNITSIIRGMNYTTASASWNADTALSKYSLRPEMLESSFQAIMCAFSSPLSNGIWTPFHPMEIRRALVGPEPVLKSSSCEMDAFVTASSVSEVVGDVSLYNEDGRTMVQIEGLVMKSSHEADSSTDRNLFSHVVWESDPFGYSVVPPYRDSEGGFSNDADRVALHHFHEALDEIDPLEVSGFLPHHQNLYREIRRLVNADGRKSHSNLAQPGQPHITENNIQALISGLGGRPDLRAIHLLGKRLPAILRGEADAVNHLNEVNTLKLLFQGEGNISALNRSICEIVRGISHKHPHMKILDLGSEIGVATEEILNTLDGSYSSYNLTGTNELGLKDVLGRLSTQHKRLSFRYIDLTTAMSPEPGDSKYDMVIAASPLRATGDPHRLFENCRAIMRPGGYLVFVELLGSMPISLLCTFGFFPQWWQSYDQEKQTWPEKTSVRCDAQLRSTGFSGIDHISHGSIRSDGGGFSVIITQAVNDTVSMLREPMTSTSLMPLTETVVLIGGKGLLVSRLIHGLRRILAASGTATEVVEDIAQLDLASLSKKHSVISLTELEQHFFSRSHFQKRLLFFQELVDRSKHVLWLTVERLKSLSVGVGRAMRSSASSNVQLQFLELSNVVDVSPTDIVKVFLRLAWSSLPELSEGQTLWTNEPELRWDGSTLCIPRLVQDHERNRRYNDERQNVLPVASFSQASALTPVLNDASDSIAVQVKYSILLCEDLYLWTGTTVDEEKKLLGFSECVSPLVQAKREDVYTLSTKSQDLSPEMLRVIATFISANLLTRSSLGPMILYEPDEMLAAALEQIHEAHHMMHFVTSKRNPPKGWIAIHPRASQRTIQKLLPQGFSAFVNLSSCDDSITIAIHKIAPSSVVQIERLYRRTLSTSPGQLIADAYTRACSSLAALPRVPLEVVSSTNILSNSQSLNTSCVVSWPRPTSVVVQGKSLGTTPIFSATGTYWMIDVNSPLGLSIMTWMARNGARSFVLAGKRPRVPEAWLEEMSCLGAVVTLCKMDSSNKESVVSVFNQIRGTLPSIIGVCYAASAFSHERYEYTLEDEQHFDRNANTATHLDELFSKPELEFFVLLTSLASLIGTPEQASYHTSALFMSGIVQQRRNKGLVGSTLSLGMVVDAGYFARQDKKAIRDMTHQGYAALSEADLHQAFCEAVIGGRPEARESSEIIVGLQKVEVQTDQNAQHSWRSNPLFSHFIAKSPEIRPVQSGEEKASSSSYCEQQPQALQPEENAYDALQGRLANKVGSMLRLSVEAMDLCTPLLDLGCDSLFAVEIQAWFAKELDIIISPMDALQTSVSAV